jgi:asparagine synthase (glutamine-hydrolysing)
MCAIAGILGRPDRVALSRMTRAMEHRGPDDEGFYADADIALGFRRLAIIDVAGGQQPLPNEDATIQVVFNGEIYNHRALRAELTRRGHHLRSESDGEVLAHLYEEEGAALVERLNGIFAFAIWDSRARRLLLARDHHGVKPLYYAEVDGRLVFASEMKAMLASGLIDRQVDEEAIGQYLIYQTVPPPRTMVRDVRMLPPGTLLLHERQQTRVRSYWQPPHQVEAPVTSLDEAELIVRHGLDKAVERQMLSERPLGLFLSGGIDSSLLVALASRHTHRTLKTFSVGFAGPDEEVFTERPWAQLVAERYGTEHHEYVLTENIFRERLPHAISAMDQPTADGINSYYVSLAAAEHVTVALSGTGSDELFLGYPRDAAILSHVADASRFDGLPADYVHSVSRWLPNPDRLWPSAARVVKAARAYGAIDAELLSPRGVGLFDEALRQRIVGEALADRRFADKTQFVRTDVAPDAARPGDWLSRAQQRAYLSYVLLRDIDAMSMAHSLEVRVPFLDVEFGAALASIPWQWKLRDGVGKWILRRAMADLLPPAILKRPKMGFGLPYNVWMRRTLEPMVRDVLAPARLRRRGLFSTDMVSSMVDRFYAGDDGVWRHLWALFVAETWMTDTLDTSATASRSVPSETIGVAA